MTPGWAKRLKFLRAKYFSGFTTVLPVFAVRENQTRETQKTTAGFCTSLNYKGLFEFPIFAATSCTINFLLLRDVNK